jgi:hypothetical protein
MNYEEKATKILVQARDATVFLRQVVTHFCYESNAVQVGISYNRFGLMRACKLDALARIVTCHRIVVVTR